MATIDETTPLIRESSSSPSSPLLVSSNGGTKLAREEPSGWRSCALSVENRILFAGFLVTLAFSYTQVPLLYVFHLMECDAFYDTHPPYQGHGQRCSRDEIAAGTALQVSILGMSTTLCGTVNLFLAGWAVKKFGPRAALVAHTVVPAIRVAAQILGVIAGKRKGMLIIQSTQLITVIGGPAGYILIANIIVGEVVEPKRRTAVFGQLQGAIMLGQALGYLAGGKIGDAIGIRAPFAVAFVSFLIASIYVMCALPYIAPTSSSVSNATTKTKSIKTSRSKSRSRSSSTSTLSAPSSPRFASSSSSSSMHNKPSANSNANTNANTKKPQRQRRSVSGFFAPLRVLAPQRLRLASGAVKQHYGVVLLCSGIFIGVLATDYAPLLMQMYATVAFDFDQADNGWLMSEFAFMRSLFLLVLFPRIIAAGRGLFASRSSADTPTAPCTTTNGGSSHNNTTINANGGDAHAHDDHDGASSPATTTPSSFSSPAQLPTAPECFDATAGEQTDIEPVRAPQLNVNHHHTGHFDLVFLRWSLVIDGALTTITAFATKRWHIYLAALLLPFGSGSAPAAKGVITDMCAESQRNDALNAVTLVENVARLATQGLFGFVFASLAGVGKAYATFFCNAALAVVGMAVLLFSHFPPSSSELLDEDDDSSNDSDDDYDDHDHDHDHNSHNDSNDNN